MTASKLEQKVLRKVSAHLDLAITTVANFGNQLQPQVNAFDSHSDHPLAVARVEIAIAQEWLKALWKEDET